MNEAGRSLPVVLLLTAILGASGFQATLSALSSRLAAGRRLELEQARTAAAAAVRLAALQPAESLAASLAAHRPLDLPAGVVPGRTEVEVRVEDDADGDGDPAVDANGRVFLVSSGRRPLPMGAEARAGVQREALVGGLLPLSAALLDCAGAVRLCTAGADCPVTRSSLGDPLLPGLALAPGREGEWHLKEETHLRERVRGADAACAGNPDCPAGERDLWQAAAAAALRVLQGAADPETLDPEEQARLVSNLLDLPPEASGEVEVWRPDGSRERVAAAALRDALLSLAQEGGHVPDLRGHPLPALLAGSLQDDDGICSRLGLFEHQALGRATPLPPTAVVPLAPPLPGPFSIQGTFVLDAGLQVEAGERLAGEGLLLLHAPLAVARGGLVEWRGALLVSAAGRVTGEGEVQVTGGVALQTGAAPGALALHETSWRVRPDAPRYRRAWEAVGTLLRAEWDLAVPR